MSRTKAILKRDMNVLDYILRFNRKRHRMPTAKEIWLDNELSSSDIALITLKHLCESGHLKHIGHGQYEIVEV